MPANSNLRLFRFSLRTALAALTIFAIWFGWNAHIVRQRRTIIAEANWVVTRPPELTSRRSVSWIRRLMGDVGIERLLLDSEATASELERVKRLFPEANVVRNIRVYFTPE